MSKLSDYLKLKLNVSKKTKVCKKKIDYICKGKDYHLGFDQIVYKDGTTKII